MSSRLLRKRRSAQIVDTDDYDRDFAMRHDQTPLAISLLRGSSTPSVDVSSPSPPPVAPPPSPEPPHLPPWSPPSSEPKSIDEPQVGRWYRFPTQQGDKIGILIHVDMDNKIIGERYHLSVPPQNFADGKALSCSVWGALRHTMTLVDTPPMFARCETVAFVPPYHVAHPDNRSNAGDVLAKLKSFSTSVISDGTTSLQQATGVVARLMPGFLFDGEDAPSQSGEVYVFGLIDGHIVAKFRNDPASCFRYMPPYVVRATTIMRL